MVVISVDRGVEGGGDRGVRSGLKVFVDGGDVGHDGVPVGPVLGEHVVQSKGGGDALALRRSKSDLKEVEEIQEP